MVIPSKHKGKAALILARFESWFLAELMAFWPDKEKGKTGLTQARLAQLCGLSQRGIAYYMSGERYPDSDALRKLGKFFGIHFVEDWDQTINLKDLLDKLKALKD